MGIFKVILSLVGIVILILATYFGMKWMTKKVQTRPGNIIKVVERVNLTQDKSIVIVTVGEKCMLLGVSPSHVEKIQDLDKDEITSIQIASSLERPTFTQAMAQVISEKAKKRGGGFNDKS